MSLFTDYRRRRDARWADHEVAAGIVWAFREACVGAGVSLAVDAPIAGTSVRTPEVTNVDLGPPVRLTVRMLPGQLPEHVARVGRLIAPHLGGIALRVQDRGHGWAIVTVLASDPLAAVLPLHLPRSRAGVLLGRDEAGAKLCVEPVDLPHVIAQGATRSGKSRWLYAVLAQLAARADVEVAGIDPSGLTLRPFARTRHAHRQACGLADLAHIEDILIGLVAEMDRRLAVMPAWLDVLPLGEGTPLLAVVLEEYPALLRALDTADPKQGKRVRALVARLLAEAHKIGVRVLVVAQRAEATIVGGAERAQCEGRLSFRTDNAESLRLLHPDADDLAVAHATASPGVALMAWPGRPTFRIRAPHIATYSEYAAAVARAVAA